MPLETSAAPKPQTTNEGIHVDQRRDASARARLDNLAHKPLSDGGSSMIKLNSFISPQSKTMAAKETRKESKKRDKNSVTGDSFGDVLKKHGLEWALCFLAGLTAGGAFGWPPFTKRKVSYET